MPLSPPAPTAATRRISRCLAECIGDRSYDMWFGDTTRLHVEGECVQVATNTKFVATWIASNFLGDLDRIAREALGERARVDVRVAPDLFEIGAAVSQTPDERCSNGHGGRGQATASPARHRVPVRQLADFVVGHSNRLAFSAASRIAQEPSTASDVGSPLFLHGECGVGKTHLLQGTVHRFTELGRGTEGNRACYLTAEQFTNEYIHAVRNNTLQRFRRRMRQLELLAIDDVHFLLNKVATQKEFLHTIDAISLAGARLVLASDEHPRQLGFSEALRSRFVAGMVASIERPDLSTRITLARKLAEERGFSLTTAAAEALAARCTGSVRELQGALNKLAALRQLAAGSSEAEVGLVLVEQLSTVARWRPKTPVRIDMIVDQVCARLVVNRAQLLGSGRHQRVVLARGLIAFLGRELTTRSYPELARCLGRRHHSTIHTAVRRIERQLAEHRLIDVGLDTKTLSINELADQLRHSIMRAARSP